MSAAAGLSAARRRRAGGNTGVDTGSSSINKDLSSKSTQQQVNPIQILNNHELKISQIVKKIESMDIERKEMKEYLNNDNNGDIVTELFQRVTMLEKKKDVDDSAEDIEFFKNKTKLLEEQLADVKRLLLKVQSFALETNLSLMKVNKNLESNVKDGGKDLTLTHLDTTDLTK